MFGLSFDLIESQSATISTECVLPYPQDVHEISWNGLLLLTFIPYDSRLIACNMVQQLWRKKICQNTSSLMPMRCKSSLGLNAGKAGHTAAASRSTVLGRIGRVLESWPIAPKIGPKMLLQNCRRVHSRWNASQVHPTQCTRRAELGVKNGVEIRHDLVYSNPWLQLEVAQTLA